MISPPNDPNTEKEVPPPIQEPPLNENNGYPDNLLDYCKTNLRDMIAYALLIIGILILFFEPIVGGLLVGLVFGIYFGNEVIAYLTHWKEGIHYQRVAKHIIIAGLAIAFFISAPAIFIGTAIAMAIKQLFNEPKTLG